MEVRRALVHKPISVTRRPSDRHGAEGLLARSIEHAPSPDAVLRSRRAMEREVQGGRTAVARELGQHHYHCVLSISAANQEGDLQDQCDRVAERDDAHADAEPSNLPERQLDAEAGDPVDSASVEELESDPSLKTGAAELPDDVWRRARTVGGAEKTSVTQFV
jgi:hypothetical protein